ncbi:MAG TPA: rRNA maturation RNase YbeY [Acidobacteriota bacterium]|nr:rRNA maturation RNase YbeY [Acidobacteriota bacterium]
MRKPKILVNLKSYQRKWQIKPSAMRQFSQKVWDCIGRAGIKQNKESEVTFVFLNSEQMKRYNKQYRGKDNTTDVLSFPVREQDEENKEYLGDILICIDKASENAKAAKQSLDKELQILTLHGILHLTGFDHETDQGQMDKLESKLRKKVLDSTILVRN